MQRLTRYPEIVELAARQRAPQHVVHYLRDLAQEFHTYYNAHRFIVDDEALRDARVLLINAPARSFGTVSRSSACRRRRRCRRCAMAKRKTKKRKTRSRKQQPGPMHGWVWGLFGLGVGLSVSAFHLSEQPTGRHRAARTPQTEPRRRRRGNRSREAEHRPETKNRASRSTTCCRSSRS